MKLEGRDLGRYKLLPAIGIGGMGEVYCAEDKALNRKVAIKILSVDNSQKEGRDAIHLFRRETRAIAFLTHPHILQIYDVGEETNGRITYVYMVMPYCEDGSLKSWHRHYYSNAPLTVVEVAHFVRQAADALQCAHNKGIIHRDVKPQNFLVQRREGDSKYPNLLLSDFGVAKFLGATQGATQESTGLGKGTVAYMAPEQQDRKNAPLGANDQYSLAVMTYELLTGRLPFEGDFAQVLYQHRDILPPAPSTINGSIHLAVDRVVMKALAKKHEHRYTSIAEFARAFEEASRSGEPGKDRYMMLTINRAEALTGVRYPVTFAGNQEVIVQVPSNAQAGQEITIQHAGERSAYGGPPGTLFVTLAIKPDPNEDQLFLEQLHRLSTNIDALQKRPIDDPGLVQHVQRLSQDMAQLLNTTAPVSIKQPKDISRYVARQFPVGMTALTILLLVAFIVGNVLLFSAVNGAVRDNGDRNLSAISTADAGLTATAIAQETAIAQATVLQATATITDYPSSAYGGSGKLVLYDPLADNRAGHDWDEGNGCSFVRYNYFTYVYSLSQTGNSPVDCFANNTQFTKFVFEVGVRLISGNDLCAGIAFKSIYPNYSFTICSDGSYTIYNFRGYISYSLIKTNGQENIIAVKIDNQNISYYVNGSSLPNTTLKFTHGSVTIGFVASPRFPSQSFQAEFNNARVWAIN